MAHADFLKHGFSELHRIAVFHVRLISCILEGAPIICAAGFQRILQNWREAYLFKGQERNSSWNTSFWFILIHFVLVCLLLNFLWRSIRVSYLCVSFCLKNTQFVYVFFLQPLQGLKTACFCRLPIPRVRKELFFRCKSIEVILKSIAKLQLRAP